MMKVHQLNAFDDNYIWLIGCNDKPDVGIVDPGDADPVIEYLEREGLRPAAILITHHHGDHTGGITELLERYPVPVYGPAGERIPALTPPQPQGDEVELAACDIRLQVLDTPGHTRGHICYYGHGALFSGDTLFAAGCGRLFEGTAEQMYHSLEKIRALPDETQVYCAHEYTQANLGFAVVAEPHNAETRSRLQEVTEQRRADRPTVHREGHQPLPALPYPFTGCRCRGLCRAPAGHSHRGTGSGTPLERHTGLNLNK